MKAIQVSFDGGPLAGRTITQDVPKHWKFLRYEHKVGEQIHVYYGKVGLKRATLQYVGEVSHV